MAMMLKSKLSCLVVLVASLALGARPAVDVSTPKAAALSAIRAQNGGTLEELKATTLADDAMYEELTARAASTAAGNNCVEAIKAIFGEAAAADFAQFHGLDDQRRLVAVDQGLVSVTGDRAVLDCPNIPGLSFRLRKVQGGWRLDLSDEQPTPGLASIYAGAAKVWNETAIDVTKRKYKTVEAIEPELEAKMDKAMAALPPTTAPSTRPATRPAAAAGQ